MSTATYPPGTDLMPPKQALDLRQRPPSTSMQLVHTEEVTGSIPVSPTRSEAMSIFVGIAVGAIPVASGQRAGTLPAMTGRCPFSSNLVLSH